MSFCKEIKGRTILNHGVHCVVNMRTCRFKSTQLVKGLVAKLRHSHA